MGQENTEGAAGEVGICLYSGFAVLVMVLKTISHTHAQRYHFPLSLHSLFMLKHSTCKKKENSLSSFCFPVFSVVSWKKALLCWQGHCPAVVINRWESVLVTVLNKNKTCLHFRNASSAFSCFCACFPFSPFSEVVKGTHVQLWSFLVLLLMVNSLLEYADIEMYAIFCLFLLLF